MNTLIFAPMLIFALSDTCWLLYFLRNLALFCAPSFPLHAQSPFSKQQQQISATTFTAHFIDADGDQDFDEAYSICAADLDNDLDMDIVAAAEYGGIIAWLENTLLTSPDPDLPQLVTDPESQDHTEVKRALLLK